MLYPISIPFSCLYPDHIKQGGFPTSVPSLLSPALHTLQLAQYLVFWCLSKLVWFFHFIRLEYDYSFMSLIVLILWSLVVYSNMYFGVSIGNNVRRNHEALCPSGQAWWHVHGGLFSPTQVYSLAPPCFRQSWHPNSSFPFFFFPFYFLSPSCNSSFPPIPCPSLMCWGHQSAIPCTSSGRGSLWDWDLAEATCIATRISLDQGCQTQFHW